MAKRFTDTGKWNKEWYRRLGARLRDLRQFILDKCDHAGIWDIDLGACSFYLGDNIGMDDVEKAFNEEVKYIDGGKKIFIPAFIKFQYGLLSSSNIHNSVLNRLQEFLTESEIEGFTNPSRRAKEKDKDKEKEKEKEKDFAPRKEKLKIEVATASQVFRGIKTYGPDETNALKLFLGDDLYGLVVKVGVRKIREMPDNAFAERTLCTWLQNAGGETC